MGPLYLELIDIEKQIAAKAGYDSFPAFSYDYQYGRDYTPEDSRALWASVKRYAVPLIRALYSSFTQEEYSGLMLAYNARDQLSERKRCLDAYASTISPLMQEAYNYLEEYGLGIIGTSDTSQDGAFTGYLSDYDAPFLYLREQGGYMDILNLLHEFGHFFSAYLGGQDTLLCMSPDVAEICSQANELLFLPTFGEYYPSDTYNGILKQKMIDVLYIVVNACLYDEFQQYVYEHELSTVEELNDAFLAISTDYGMGQGYYIMDARYVWVTMRHNFQFPMYHISYGASIIPAMQIFDISLRDREQAIHIYLQVVESDPTLTFSQVLEQVGLSSPFEEQTIVDIINAVADAVDLNYEVSVPAA